MIKIITDITYKDSIKIFEEFEDKIYLSFYDKNLTYIVMENDFYDEISDVLIMDYKKETIDVIMEKQKIAKYGNPFFGNLSI